MAKAVRAGFVTGRNAVGPRFQERTMLIWLARIANVLFIASLFYLFLENGPPKRDGEIIMLFIIVLLPIINLMALKEMKVDHLWPFIYFKRLAIEEKMRIQSIENRKIAKTP